MKRIEGDCVSVLFRFPVGICVCVKRIEGDEVGVHPYRNESCLTCN